MSIDTRNSRSRHHLTAALLVVAALLASWLAVMTS
jgi:hypothetical protein